MDLLPPRDGSLGPAPSVRHLAWGLGVALARGTPWGHVESLGGGGGGGRASGCSGSVWDSHGARITRGPAAASLPAIGESAPERPEATPLSLPGPLDRLGLRVQRGKTGTRLLLLFPYPGVMLCPGPWCPSLLLSVPRTSALLTRSGAGQVCSRCETYLLILVILILLSFPCLFPSSHLFKFLFLCLHVNQDLVGLRLPTPPPVGLILGVSD